MNLKAFGMFLLRVVIGVIFIAHGWAKLQGMEGTIMFFGTLGLAPFLAYLVAWAEFVGGLMIVLGIYSRVAAYVLAINMVFAIALVKAKIGFLGGYELDLALLAALLAIAWSGSGPYSVSGQMCGCGSCAKCGMKLM